MTPTAISRSWSIAAVCALAAACAPPGPVAGDTDDDSVFEPGQMVGAPEAAEDAPRGVYVVAEVETPEVAPAAYQGGMIFYMNRDGGTYYRSHRNNSSANETTIARENSVIEPWGVSENGWDEVMACVRDQFARFDVHVTDQDPGDVPHIESVVAGHPEDLGLPSNIGGVSPFASDCSVIDRSIVFNFAELFGDNHEFLCQVIAQEVAHSIGLDHELLCEDPMSYLGGCGAKSFQDVYAPCGEQEERACACGDATQNSVAMLSARLGRPGDAEGAPELSIVTPRDGDLVGSGFELAVEASDDDGIDSVRVLVDGFDYVSMAAPPYEVAVDMPLEIGQHSVTVEAIDTTGATTRSTVEVIASGGADLTNPLDGLGACSAGGSAGGLGGLLVAFALGAVRRRRRAA